MQHDGHAPLVVDVLDPRLAPPRIDDELRVVVEPLYAAVAVAAALDAGWESVEVAPLASDVAPIPLVSFEQPPGDGARRCRVRSSELLASIDHGMLLGAPAFARPLCARMAATASPRITFLPALAGAGDEVAGDAWWASGMLIRVLLDELDGRDAQLTDAAGIAVTLAQGAEDVAAQLSTGVRWHGHLARGGHPDDLRIAAAVDSLALVPAIRHDGDTLVAHAW
ncbi:MAG: hypothetical protein KDC46_16215 [Thermoleophilia bacterium]|nr:hypothetical protein [Thermoleophilia bacterium]